jgi:UDP-N-acetyl-2-amino-2-deoxyglucuronate dehydrogenase
MSEKRIKFAVVGCGHVGKRHADMISRNEDTELVALCDILPEEQTGTESFDVPYFSSMDDMLSSCDTDVVSVCTPNGLHAEHALKALEAKKHVVCEKPMALKKSDCEAIIFKALQVHKQVFCVMQNRYSPPANWLKQLVESKALGHVFMVQLNCYWNRDERYYKADSWKGKLDMDGGVLFTQFSHFIDMLYWLFGDIYDIRGQFSNFTHTKNTEFDDSGAVSFRFNKEGIGSLNFSTSVWDKNFESSITIIAENGTVKIGGQYMDIIEYCHIKNVVKPVLPPTNPANDYGPYKGSAANHHYIIENVVNTLKNGSTTSTNALEGMKVVEIIEKIYESKSKQK